MKSFVPLIKSDWRLLLFGFALMFFSSPGQTYFIALFGGEIRSTLNLSHGEFGAVYSLATLLSAFLLLWTGPLIDRVPLKTFSYAVVIGLALACVVMAGSHNVLMLFVAILLLRQLGQGLMSMTSASTMVRYLSASKGKANSLANMGYSAAEATLPSVIIALLAFLSWRQTWLLVALTVILLLPMVIRFLLREQVSRHTRYLAEIDEREAASLNGTMIAQQRQWTRAEVIRDPLFYMFVPGLLSQSMLYTGFMFHQIHLVDEKGWPLVLWGSLYLLFSLTAIVMSLVIGSLVDRWGAVRLAPFVTTPMALGLLILSTADSTVVAVVFMLCMAVSTAAQAAVTTPFFAERYGNKYFGSIKSLGTFTMVLLSAISPVVLGWFIDRGVSMDQLAQASAGYAVGAALLAYAAYRVTLKQTA
ncbi:MAG: MFS transporter [Gammaproteobacteria bacterium]|nr:MFS transporter [Gammaproteobacteria bacterium]